MCGYVRCPYTHTYTHSSLFVCCHLVALEGSWGTKISTFSLRMPLGFVAHPYRGVWQSRLVSLALDEIAVTAVWCPERTEGLQNILLHLPTAQQISRCWKVSYSSSFSIINLGATARSSLSKVCQWNIRKFWTFEFGFEGVLVGNTNLIFEWKQWMTMSVLDAGSSTSLPLRSSATRVFIWEMNYYYSFNGAKICPNSINEVLDVGGCVLGQSEWKN